MALSRSEAEDRERILRLQCLAAAELNKADINANNLDDRLKRAQEVYDFVTANDEKEKEKEDAPF